LFKDGAKIIISYDIIVVTQVGIDFWGNRPRYYWIDQEILVDQLQKEELQKIP